MSPDTPKSTVRAASPAAAETSFLDGGEELGAMIRQKDWTQTPLGEPAGWPASLKTAVRIMLASRQPFWIGWGSDLVYLYNDAYKSIIGGKHPAALGQPTARVWREIWEDIEPMLTTALSGMQGTYVEAQRLIMERYGYPEETYYTFSYSPIPDEHGRPGGIICANTDDTRRVIGERQISLLRELGARTADARTVEDVCGLTAEALATDPYDLPFAMIYLADAGKHAFVLMGTSGMTPGHVGAPLSIDNDSAVVWPLAEAIAGQTMSIVDDLDLRFGKHLPTGAWKSPPSRAAIIPFTTSKGSGRSGALVVGLSPFRLFDDGYRGFLSLAAGQVGASLGGAEAFEQERRRAEALAELDKAKTIFFSNVSHELRTPLTLMLGPLEDVLAGEDLPAHAREHLEVAQRNSVRLLKLVNSLLDFSRIEAGRMRARFEPTDLAAYTAELASMFRSTIEQSGMTLVLDCAPLPRPVCIDRDMWEKIVLNLVSNAFKYTHDGTIEVSLGADGDRAVLVVRDSGIGIPQSELANVFERFHRVDGARGRTQEGTGIGLALVQELVKLHGGSVRVESAEGRGSAFFVVIPFGSEHESTGHVVASGQGVVGSAAASAYVEEAMRWLPGNRESATSTDIGGDAPLASRTLDAHEGRILLAEDNADMRAYVRRLLSAYWTVEAAVDGNEALAAARRSRPDLILSDVMMPGLDGFELLRSIREDETLRDVPFVMLSARAGEEARVEGLAAGVDDYLVKPFSARELIAKVRSQLDMAALRRQGEQRVLRVLESITDGFQVIDRNGRVSFMNQAARRVFAEHGMTPDDLIGREIGDEVFPASRDSEGARQLRRVMIERVPAAFEAVYEPWRQWFSVRAYPIEEGGVAVYFHDITQRKEIEAERQLLMQREAQLREDAEALYDVSRAVSGELDLEAVVQKVTDAATRLTAAEFGAFFYNVTDDEGQAYLLYTLSGAPRAAFDGFGMPRNTAVFAPTFEGTGIVRSDDIRKDPRYGKQGPHFGMPKGHLPVVSYLAVPVRSREGTVVGGLFFGHGEPARFSERAERLAVGIAAMASIAFDNARLFEASNREIAERIAAERAIKTSEGRFRALITASSYAVYRMSPDWAEMTELDGMNQLADTREPTRSWMEKYVPAEDRAQLMHAIAEAIRGKHVFQMEHRMRRTDGSIGWTVSRAVPLLDEAGNIVEWFGAASDVTDRKRFEQELAAETRILELMATGAPLPQLLERVALSCEQLSEDRLFCAILLVDETGKRLMHGAAPSLPGAFNEAIDGLRIESGAGACGTAAREKRFVCVSDIAASPLWRDLRDVAALHGLAACCSQPILSRENRVLGTISIYFDTPHEPSSHDRVLFDRATHIAGIIIERAQTESQIRLALEAEREARAEAEHANRLRDEFLATLSHELRTPLNAILGWSQVLRMRHRGLDGEIGEGLAVIERNSRVQVQLVEDLLDMSRIVSGKLRMDVQHVDIADVIKAAIESARPAGEAKEIRIQTVLDNHVGPVRGDPARLQQVVWNLLTNAIKFTPRGGRVQIALERVNSHIEITVTDTGEGIAPDFLPYVFERFRQADAKTTRGHGGLGLGLAIVKSLVEAHGGKVRAKSPGLGEGATFSIELPLMVLHEEGSLEQRRHPRRTTFDEEASDIVCSQHLLEGLTVLVVDDDKDARDLVKMVLEECHASVLPAASTAEGFELLLRHRPQVILSDVGMPGEDGYQFMQRIRALSAAEGGDTPAAALTAFARSEDRRRALIAGYQSHIAKPVEPAELVTVVASLGGRTGRRR